MTKEKTVTIEKTSKKLKSSLLMWWVAFFTGGYLMMSDEAGSDMSVFGTMLLIGSIAGLFVTKLLIWWNHD